MRPKAAASSSSPRAPALSGPTRYNVLTTLYLQRGERVAVTAGEATEMLHLGLPDLSALSSDRSGVTAVAAE